MGSQINKILKEIELKKEELKKEYEKMMKKYDFSFIKGKIIFSKKAKEKNKKQKKPILDTIFHARIREIISMPFIYSMIIPFIIVDIFLFMYQQTAIRLYGIPLAKRSDYIVYDRKHLDYLNALQKINCLYCSYVNGLIAYAAEVAGRTEKYWCPIKNASRMEGAHRWHKYFVDYGDAEGFKEVFTSTKEYYEDQENKES